MTTLLALMAHHRSTFLSASLGMFLILNVGAETQRQAAWQLTPEERAAARQAEIARQRATTGRKETDATRVRISGAATPELFLPIELFRHLVLIAFDPNPAAQNHVRRGLLDRATTAGVILPPDFWSRMESAVTAYLASNQRTQRVSERLKSPTTSGRAANLKELRAGPPFATGTSLREPSICLPVGGCTGWIIRVAGTRPAAEWPTARFVD